MCPSQDARKITALVFKGIEQFLLSLEACVTSKTEERGMTIVWLKIVVTLYVTTMRVSPWMDAASPLGSVLF